MIECLLRRKTCEKLYPHLSIFRYDRVHINIVPQDWTIAGTSFRWDFFQIDSKNQRSTSSEKYSIQINNPLEFRIVGYIWKKSVIAVSSFFLLL